MKIIEHEKLVLQLVKRFIDTHEIECDFDYCKTFDVIMERIFFDMPLPVLSPSSDLVATRLA